MARQLRLNQTIRALWGAFGALGVAACGAKATDTGTETHWLSTCQSDSQCGALQCLCGKCTLPCDQTDSCPSQAPECARVDEAMCGAATPLRVCTLSFEMGDPEQAEAGLDDASMAPLMATTTDRGRADAQVAASSTESPASTAPARDGSVGAMPSGALAPPASAACGADGWCWESPTPAGDLFFALSSDGTFAVGEHGVIFEPPSTYHYLGDDVELRHVERLGDDVWTGGVDGLWHFAGDAWEKESDARVDALSISPDGEVWALLDGQPHQLLEGVWTIVPAPSQVTNLADLVAFGDQTVWVLDTFAVGRMIGVSQLEYARGTWSENPTDLADYYVEWRIAHIGEHYYVHDDGGFFPGIYDPNDNWALIAEKPAGGYGGLYQAPDGRLMVSDYRGLYAFDSTGVEQLTDVGCQSLVATESSWVRCAVELGGLSELNLGNSAILPALRPEFDPALPTDAQRFGQVPTPIWALSDVAWGVSGDDAWRRPLDHFDGSSWTSYVDVAPITQFDAQIITGSASDNVWFAASVSVQRWNGLSFDAVPLPSEEAGTVSAMITYGPSNTWLVQATPEYFQILQYDGREWTITLNAQEDSIPYSRAALVGVENDMWAVVGRAILRWDGAAWREALRSEDTLIDAAYDSGDFWLLGQHGVYQVVEDAIVKRGNASGTLDHLALTDDRVWHHSGDRARSLGRLQP